ncbi:MAG: hypothetical protein GOV15_02990 [Candidatus Diapherotrites archaeon]|nr:hypothetical protein [Candidatus Diapherotrites archaeon]
MSKGLSPVIAVVFLMLLSATLVVLLHGYLTGLQGGVTASTTEAGSAITGATSRGFIESVDVTNDRIYIKNQSDVGTEIDSVYIDNVKTTCTTVVSLPPRGSAVVSVGNCGVFDAQENQEVLVAGSNNFRVIKRT